MITKDQYLDIIDLIQKYLSAYQKMFPNKPMSNDFCAGMEQTIDLIKSLVKKD